MMPPADQRLLAVINPAAILALVVTLGLLFAFALMLYRGCERWAQSSLNTVYAGIEIHAVAVPTDVVVVYHTYHGFLIWFTETEHRVTLPLDDARELLGRLLRFNLTWGLVAKGGILVAPLAISNYVIQKRSIMQQETAAALATLQPNVSGFPGPRLSRRRRSWFRIVFGGITALFGGFFAVVGIYALAIGEFRAGFGGIGIAVLFVWIARDWLRKGLAGSP